MSGAGLVRGDALAIPLGDATVDLIVTSPPYFALRSYRDGGEHYDGQIGSEPTPTAFLEALWAVTAECWRVLKPGGSLFVNLGDKYAGTGGGNGQTGIGGPKVAGEHDNRSMPKNNTKQTSGYVRSKSLMGLPWRFAGGCVDGLADPCVKDHEHVGRHPAYLPSEQCRGRGWINRSEIIWQKPNGLPESAKDRVHRKHEGWYHLTKSGSYHANIDAVRAPHAAHTLYCAQWESDQGGYERKRSNPNRQDGGNNTSTNPPNPLGKIPGSVWEISTQPLVTPEYMVMRDDGDMKPLMLMDDAAAWQWAERPGFLSSAWPRRDEGHPMLRAAPDHFAAFPTEWPRRLILGWCPPGGVVLDPFGGTGTTAMVARALGRYGVSMDLSADYQRLARWRIWESGQAAKVAAKTDGERQAELFA